MKILLIAFLAMSFSLFACSKSDSGSDSKDKGGDTGGDADDDGDDDGSVTEGTLALGFPEDLAVTSPYDEETPAELTSSNEQADAIRAGAINVELNLAPEPASNGPKKFGEKRLEMAQQLYSAESTSECPFDYTPPPSMNPTCYGPGLEYKNHPNATGGDPTDGNLPGGDLGIWAATDDSGAACTAVKMNSLISEFAGKVDRLTGIAATLLCIARVKGEELPADGETLDMMEHADEFPSSGGNFPFEITDAQITQDGAGVYLTEFTFEDSSSPNNEVRIFTANLKHTPLDDTNSTYKGKLWASESVKGVRKSTDCGEKQASDLDGKQQHAFSINYHKASASDLKLEVRTSKHLTGETVLFDSNNNPRLPSTCNTGAEYSVMDIDPTSGTGKVAYAWVAGHVNENTRSFVSEVESDGSTKSGCGFFGFGPSMEEMMGTRENAMPTDRKIGFIDRFICNWAGPSNSHAGKPLVQKQCMEQGSSGQFAPTLNNIKYSPQNECEDTSGAFEVKANFINNEFVPAVDDTDQNLVPIDDLGSDDLKSPAIPTGD